MSNINKTNSRFGGLLHMDLWLLFFLLLLIVYGVFVLSSAAGGSWDKINGHIIRLSLSMIIIVTIAQIPPKLFRMVTPWLFIASIMLLLLVIFAGDIGKGARRWLSLGLFSFQPSELIKVALPMVVAWIFADSKFPPSFLRIILSLVVIAIPTWLIALQPDLGTAIIVAVSGLSIIFIAGIHWIFIFSAIVVVVFAIPIVWSNMYHYQQQRILTFLNPESDPLGSGYHIIQSKIAIGSGGFSGKGWFAGSQSQFDFLPESTTDFIFAVLAEELGFVGVLLLLSIYALILGRSWFITYHAQGNFSRLLAGSLMITFFVYVFVNVGMVSGILPVVGVPLPFISYGGTSMLTLSVGFGILMSIHTHRRMLSNE